MFDRSSWRRWRTLFDELGSYGSDAWEHDVLLPWAATNRPAVDELHRIGQADSRDIAIAPDPENYTPLEVLYVVSRVLDVLIAPYQIPIDDPATRNWVTGRPRWTGRVPSSDAYPAFCTVLGCRPIEEPNFHPFLHEIVRVMPATDPDEPIQLVDQQWPGFFIGSMLLTRAGVTVRAGANRLVPEIAERSALYWAWWRRNRPACDLSHGWGANSQWSTGFRRDYWVAGQLYYNVDALDRPRDAEPDLSPEAARTLLRFRCSTTIDLDRDRGVWQTQATEPAPH